MLSMLFLLALAPQAEAPAQTPRPATIQMPAAPSFSDGNAAGTPVLSDRGFGCESRPLRTNDLTSGSNLMWREDGEAVGLYRLLDRRVNGCAEPIIVNYRVPGSNAVGRELGRSPQPLPTVSMPVVRAD